MRASPRDLDRDPQQDPQQDPQPDPRQGPRPPRIVVALLARLLPPADRAALLGDLEEGFRRRAADRGPGAARRWYLRQGAGLLLRTAWWGMRRGPTGWTAPTVFDDAAHAFRSARRAPGFSLFTAAVIGLGVGAVTTVYSVLAPLALSLPFDEPNRLVWIANEGEAGDSSLSAVTSRVVNLVDFRERARSFDGITGYDAFFAGRFWTLGGATDPEGVEAVAVAPDFLDVLGVEPALGRSFTEEEGRPGGPPAVVLAHDFWRTRFAGDPEVVGRTVRLNDTPHKVAGVLPEEFDFSSVFAPTTDVDMLLPFAVSRDHAFQGNVLALVGRLRPGVGVEAAGAELSAIADALGREEPERWGLGARVTSLQAHLAGPFAHSLALVAAAAGTLLLVVCVNVAMLLLARAPSRRREMAVRKAMGAGRGRLLRQLLLETVGVSLLGAGAGAVLAWVATGFVRRAAGLEIPLMGSVEVDAGAFAVAVAVAVATGVVVGVVPALRVADGDEAEALRSGSRGRTAGPGERRLRSGLVVAEVGLACLLLVVGGLVASSFRAVLAVEMGFDAEDAVAWKLQPSVDFTSLDERAAFYARVADAVDALPGVESAGLVDGLPLSGNRAWPFEVVGRPAEEDTDEEVFPHVVGPGYLETLRIPLLAGRGFTPADRGMDEGGTDQAPRVVVLNETAAERIFGGVEAALGRRLDFWGPWEWKVVGVARDVRHLSPELGAGMEVYFPLGQMPDFRPVELVVRSELPPARLAEAVAPVLREIEPGMPVREYRTLEGVVAGAVSARRFALTIVAAFGAAGLLLAALGIYGVLARTVAERRGEIGIRMALGATAGSVAREVGRSVLTLTVAGIAGGWAVALALSGVLEGALFGVGPVEPLAFVGTAALLLAVAGVAALVPVRRAVATEVSEVLKAG